MKEMLWNFWRKKVKVTGFVPESIGALREYVMEHTANFGISCHFDSEGACQKVREKESRSPIEGDFIKRGSCCCSNCAKANGYFMPYLMTKEQYDFVNENWDEDRGLHREVVGCILPRKWRSNVCAFFFCYHERHHQENTTEGSSYCKTSRHISKVKRYVNNRYDDVFLRGLGVVKTEDVIYL